MSRHPLRPTVLVLGCLVAVVTGGLGALMIWTGAESQLMATLIGVGLGGLVTVAGTVARDG